MSRPPIRVVPLTDPRLSLCLAHRDSEGPEGFWLYDKDAGINVAMRAPSELAAFEKAVQYWKDRALRSEKEHDTLQAHVTNFVNLVDPRPEDDET